MAIRVGRFAIVEGDVREHGPWLIEQARDGDPRIVQLIVLVEPVDERSAEFCEDVAGAVADLFVSEELSLTGGLVRAMRRAHMNLAEWNRRSLREHRVAVGVTCVVLRDGEATIAQAGPGLVYLVGADGTRRVTTAGEPAASPLGSDGEITPQFIAARTDETSILLLSSFAETEAGPSAIGRVLNSHRDRLLGDLFLQVRNVADVHAVFIADVPTEAEPADVESVEDAPSDLMPPPPEPIPYPEAPQVRVTVVPSGESETSISPRRAEAGELLTNAGETSDIGEQRELLNGALRQLEEARSVDAEDPRIADLQRVVQERLDEVNGVIEIDDIETVVRFEGVVTHPLTPDALAVGARRLWVMDSALGRVLATDPAGIFVVEEAFRAGQRYGGVAAATPIAIAWDAMAERLLVLDEERSLFAVELGEEPVALRLRDADELGSVDALAVHAGSLYVLDAEGGEVWRYLPTGTGFDSERTALLGSASLDGASGLHVGGDLFVLGAESVHRFEGSREGVEQLQGIDRVLNAPVGLAADSDTIYIADRGGNRIVVGHPGGAFLRQYTHPDFTDLRGIALASDGEVLYVLTGLGILSFEPTE